ncbi:MULTISPECIES: DUF2288 domain-containing protein [unclassified Undibacterium]|uniref:DUF2288 domain-containing protein n=1 Tax=unclassified Undibacterium TaxID=2630295 RepID=UPI002AC9A3EA|nr:MULTISPECIES: DUF2288 domain-containing protein [unclassified Undibacterium]MEB0140612.1 DUF2288 domain-containing protein [Undibacterium sp. CCC2.1]MEB0173482.1 DUF2288 domain-containing protein [Undibacterium sp. CCC1.1]MEB0177616.1 DUF2288 domain-containing protein [Undibacterium sp. CCC3.4]MEB0216790.1 DUF2288 domain-containing protein [Undibacterium sp. 5I2]WPX44660.1 DUF2288 domain-containing protein [Undibacterium sp. CCC3.4]
MKTTHNISATAMPDTHLLHAKINGETARCPWRDLLKQFASGSVIALAPGLDLVAVALLMTRDDSAAIAGLLAVGQLAKVSDAQAQQWLEQDCQVWSVVVNPWVLVQPAE